MSDDREKLTRAFAELFPLAPRRSLPYAPCHIADFLRERIRAEIEYGTLAWTSEIVKVLCEAAPLKTHAVDMARIVVDKAKRYEQLRYSMELCLGEHTSTLAGPRMVSVPEDLIEQIKYLLAVYPAGEEE